MSSFKNIHIVEKCDIIFSCLADGVCAKYYFFQNSDAKTHATEKTKDFMQSMRRILENKIATANMRGKTIKPIAMNDKFNLKPSFIVKVLLQCGVCMCVHK